MNWNQWIRQGHRWLSMLFVAAVVVTSVAMARGQGGWITYLPLGPLLLLALSGLYLFVLPYLHRGRAAPRR